MEEWRFASTAERKSPATVALYLDAVARHLTWPGPRTCRLDVPTSEVWLSFVVAVDALLLKRLQA